MLVNLTIFIVLAHPRLIVSVHNLLPDSLQFLRKVGLMGQIRRFPGTGRRDTNAVIWWARKQPRENGVVGEVRKQSP
jgi:hypothetical protein